MRLAPRIGIVCNLKGTSPMAELGWATSRLTNAETHLVLKAGSGVEVENARRGGA